MDGEAPKRRRIIVEDEEINEEVASNPDDEINRDPYDDAPDPEEEDGEDLLETLEQYVTQFIMFLVSQQVALLTIRPRLFSSLTTTTGITCLHQSSTLMSKSFWMKTLTRAT